MTERQPNHYEDAIDVLDGAAQEAALRAAAERIATLEDLWNSPGVPADFYQNS